MSVNAAPRVPVLQRKKQAVIIIHGIGEQRPMETLRSFVDTVWTENEEIGPAAERETWLTPDETTGSLELRRFTTSYHGGARTDFFELYWADLMEGSTPSQVWAWISGLLLRWPKSVPKPVFSAWVLLWVLSLLAVGFFLTSVFGKPPTWLRGPANAYLGVGVGLIGLVVLVWLAKLQKAGASGLVAAIILPLALGAVLWWTVPAAWIDDNATGAWRLIPMAISAGLAFFINNVFVPYVGDIARYVRAKPDTIASRKAIRERGLALLQQLHDCGRYRRIVFAAHSLGCIIAYDLINEFWALRGPNPANPGGPATLAALQEIDRYVAWTDRDGNLAAPNVSLQEFRRAQRNAFEAVRSESDDWLISDFVTLGCPLAHAPFLLVRDEAALTLAKRERLLSVAPPLPDNIGAAGQASRGRFSMRRRRRSERISPRPAGGRQESGSRTMRRLSRWCDGRTSSTGRTRSSSAISSPARSRTSSGRGSTTSRWRSNGRSSSAPLGASSPTRSIGICRTRAAPDIACTLRRSGTQSRSTMSSRGDTPA